MSQINIHKNIILQVFQLMFPPPTFVTMYIDFILFYLFLVFCVIPSNAQRLFPALHLGISPSRVWGPIGIPGIESGSSVQGKHPTFTPAPFSYIVMAHCFRSFQTSDKLPHPERSCLTFLSKAILLILYNSLWCLSAYRISMAPDCRQTCFQHTCFSLLVQCLFRKSFVHC